MEKGSEQHKMTRAAGVVGLATLASRVLGFVRDVVIAYFFGAGAAADAFFVAFRIPNLLRRLFAEGTLTIAFIPVFTEVLKKKGREEAFLLARSTLSLLALSLLIVTVLGVVFAPEVVRAIAPGFTPGAGTFGLAVELTRWCLPYIFFISLVALAGGVLNSMGHFFAPAAAPALLNLCIIAASVGLSGYVDPPVFSLALGVILGGAAQLLMQLPYLRAKGVPFRPAWDIKNPALRRMLRLMVPAIFGAAVYQVAVLMDTILASFLPSGTVSYLYYADRLIQFPLGIFAIAVSTAILPSLSRQAADNDQAALLNTMRYGLRLILFITVPAMVGLLVLARPLVVLLFMRGEFTLDTASQTAGAVMGLATGLWAIAGVRAVVQAFYAKKDIRTPVIVAALCLVVKLVLSLALMWPLKQTGLALATSASGITNLILLLFLLRRKLGLLGGRSLLRSGLGTCAAAAFMGLVVGLIAFGPDWGAESGALWRWARPAAALLAGVGVYFLAAKLMRLRELGELWQVFRGRRA
ncbi:MAG: murein biosynthesis integral membrane protein MurJ [Desulfarculaceae bacterium]|nr:murein biosynthesis integral membrane protein MurJ [Desulfarculaceae bacterium]